MNNLQLPQKDREKEIAQLESFIKSDIDARELKRAIAVRMAISGNIYQEISKILGVSNFLLVIEKKIKPKASPELNEDIKGQKGI
jgi:putative transposase